MDLLFNTTTSEGNTELKELMGFIDADLKLKNMLSDIRTASNDIIDLVGKEVYDLAVTKYANGTIANDNKAFIYAIRYPIAVNAYRYFAVSNDLAHTNNGRKMRQDEGNKLPFEWMIDKDNTSLEKRYYRALDDLIKFLDNEEEEGLKGAWTGSEAYKNSHQLFIRTSTDFDRYFPINSRLLYLKLVPGMSDCELYEIKPRLGIEKFKIIKQKLLDNGEFSIVDAELLRVVRQACVSYSLAWSMPRFSVALFPDGVLQHVTSDRATIRGEKPSLKSEVEAARQAFSCDADKAFKEIERLMTPPPTIDETISEMPPIVYGDKYFSM